MNDTRLALRVYALLVRLYPRAYQRAFGTQMRQTFHDACRDRVAQQGRSGLGFWLEVVSDAVSTSAIEHIAAWKERSVMQQTWGQQGIIDGARYGLLWIVLNVITTLVPVSTPLALLSRMLCAILFFIGMPLLYGRIGMRCSHQSRTVAAGTYASLVTSVISSAIMLGSLLFVMRLFWPIIQATAVGDAGIIWDFQHYSTATFAHYLWAKNVHEAVNMMLVSLFYAGSIGTIGGVLGVQMANARLGEPITPLTREHHHWSWSTARLGLGYGLGVGLVIGLVIGVNIGVRGGLELGLGSMVVGGVLFGLLGVLVGGLTQGVDLRLRT